MARTTVRELQAQVAQLTETVARALTQNPVAPLTPVVPLVAPVRPGTYSSTYSTKRLATAGQVSKIWAAAGDLGIKDRIQPMVQKFYGKDIADLDEVEVDGVIKGLDLLRRKM